MLKNRITFLFISFMCGYGAYMTSEEPIRLTSSNIKVEGVVKDFSKILDSDKNNREYYTYAPIFLYRFGERDYLETSRSSSKNPTLKIGQKSTLLLDPENHQRFIIDSFEEKWMSPIIWCLVSLVFGFAGVVKHKESIAIKGSSTNNSIPIGENSISAEVVAVTQDASTTIDNKVCYVIEAVHKPTGRKFKSDPITDYPFEYRVGTLVEVVLDPKNPYQGKILLTNLRKVA